MLSLPSRECGLKSLTMDIIKRGIWESLPSRECGLKLRWIGLMIKSTQSLPSRECGLKYKMPQVMAISLETSLPSRECGLKSYKVSTNSLILRVTPFAGVRIEISPPGRRLLILVVTPFVGVWIEMVFRGEISPSKIMSLSLRECRLKSKSLSLGEILDQLTHFMRLVV